jgi:branched-subunit amino acid ABC-type transport system permease component
LTDNADLATIVGVDVGRTRNLIFLVASLLAGLAGVLTAYDTGIVPSTGFQMLFIGVVAVILGGVRQILLGTLVGAICLGFLTAFAGFFFPEWIISATFLIMIVLIIIRPQGILG